MKQADTSGYQSIVKVDYDAASGKYVYSKLDASRPERVRALESTWRMQLALFYDF